MCQECRDGELRERNMAEISHKRFSPILFNHQALLVILLMKPDEKALDVDCR